MAKIVMKSGDSVLLSGEAPTPATVGVLYYRTLIDCWAVTWDDGHESYHRPDELVRWPYLGRARYKDWKR